MPAGHAIFVVVVALGLGAIFNAQALSDAADSQPFGWRRNVAIVAVWPVKSTASLLRLDRPHAALAQLAADVRGDAGTMVASTGDQAVAPPPPGSPSEGPQVEAVSAAGGTVQPQETAEERRKEVSRSKPLQLWIGGDSLVSEFGPALADVVARTHRGVAEVDFRFSTGLSRPDFFDWPEHLDKTVRRTDPDVLVVMFGANDAQNISVRGEVLDFGSADWKAEYAGRVGSLMDRLRSQGRGLYWVGQPIMASADFDARMSLLNEIYRAEAKRRPGVTYIDTRALFAADGAFSAYLDDDGQRVLMRQQDGVHLTRAGGERLAARVFETIVEQWPLVTPAR
jgi:uncharacterized protein